MSSLPMRAHGAPTRQGACKVRLARGSALVEWLVALPVLLVVGLGLLQLALVMQMRGVLEYATQQAVRRAAVEHGHGHAVEAGLLEGLRPAWQHAGISQGQARLAQALAAGWLQWERRFPDSRVLADFAVAALDEWGRPLAGEREIPNDNLRFRHDDPGARSGITLTEANRIELELRYGVPLVVPLVGGLLVRVMEIVHGCRPRERLRLGLTALGEVMPVAPGQFWGCPVFRLPDQAGGAPRWRWPMHMRAGTRMHSPLRVSAADRSAVSPASAPGAATQGPGPVPGFEPLSDALPETLAPGASAAQWMSAAGLIPAPAPGLAGSVASSETPAQQLLGVDPIIQSGRCE